MGGITDVIASVIANVIAIFTAGFVVRVAAELVAELAADLAADFTNDPTANVAAEHAARIVQQFRAVRSAVTYLRCDKMLRRPPIDRMVSGSVKGHPLTVWLSDEGRTRVR